jgi:sugar lactone lactonase YvrE
MIRPVFALFLLALLAVTPARAVGVERWAASTAAEFELGRLDGTALDADGGLHLAPGLESLWGPDAGIVWSLSADPAGGLFVGLSSPGRVLYLPEQGAPQVWLEQGEESLIASVVADGEGGVFFGESPSGKLFRISPSGSVEEIASTGAKFIWALQRTGDGSIWIGTGLPGLVLRRLPDGTMMQVFDAEDDPVRAITALRTGGVVVGTGGRGRVIRIDATGRPFVLLDAEETEIVGLVEEQDGTLFALAARSGKQVATPTSKTSTAHVERVRVTADAPSGNGDDNGKSEAEKKSSAPRAPRSFAMQAGAVLYRIDPDGGTRRLWESGREVPFGIARRPGGELLVATGDEGRLYAVDERGRASALLSLASEQISAFAVGAEGRVYLGGTGDARVERLSPGPRRAGSYLTPPIDAGSVADWGRVTWEADLSRGGKLRLYLRGGNTAEPDGTWSTWAPLEGGRSFEGKSSVPATRWLQIRVDMQPSRDAASPRLRRLEVSYRQRNRRPRIESLAVQAPGVIWTRNDVQSTRMRGPQVADDPVARKRARELRGSAANGAIRKSYELGARTFTWSASDPDDDRLRFDVEVRREGAAHWIPLVRDLDETHYSIDTRGLPDGFYRCRLVARDRLDNPGDSGLEESAVSSVFQVDNTRPALDRGRIRRAEESCEIEFTASDPGGSVVAVEVAFDGGEWEPVDPLDGVADSPSERYRMIVGGEASHGDCAGTMRVRATDAAGNLGGDAWPLSPEIP